MPKGIPVEVRTERTKMKEEEKVLITTKEEDSKTSESFKEIIQAKQDTKIEKLEFTVTIQKLMEAGVQFGHHPSYTNPKMKQYLFPMSKKEASNTVIIDLDKTIGMLENACKFLENRTARGDKVLWVGTRENASPIIEEQAKRSGGYYINHKWFGGLITNFKTVQETLRKRTDIERLCETFKEGQRIITKKEFNSKQNTLNQNDIIYKGIENMKDLPDLIILADRDEKKTIIKEAAKLKIPVVKICDTNSSPESVAFVIPSNDDSTKSLQLILTTLGDFCVSGSKIKAIKSQSSQERQNSFQNPQNNRSDIQQKFGSAGAAQNPFGGNRKPKPFIKPKQPNQTKTSV